MPAPANRRWTDEMDERLIARWQDGDTATEIYLAGEFRGFTRNAIIGRLFRLRKKRGEQTVSQRDNDPVPAPPVKKRKPRPNYDAKRERDHQQPTPIRTPAAPLAARRLPLLALGPRDCRFIVTDHMTREHLYCAVDASEFVDDYGNNCYCRFHQTMMRASVQRR